MSSDDADDHPRAVEAGGIGVPVRRKEDRRLVTGQGCYTDDIDLPGQLYAAIVRSPHAHALIASIDVRTALAVPGVRAVLTGADAAADGLQPAIHNLVPGHPPDIRLDNSDGGAKYVSPHLPLPRDKVRHVGEAVAMIVADTVAAAKDGAERVVVDYQPLPAVITTGAAPVANAPLVWDAPRNTCIDADVGDASATEAGFAAAAYVVRLDTAITRVTGVHIEPRAALCAYDKETERYTFYAGSGGVVRLKNELAHVLNVAPDRVRVVIRDVGGNFGTRNSIYPEFSLVAWASQRLARPVKWTSERSEAFLSDYQARDLVVQAELALDPKGRFLALRGELISNVGAHTVSFVAIHKGTPLMSGTYRMPAARFRARAVLSNTPPTHPYRSTGRPEAMFVIERLIDLAARRHGFDRIALRRRNLVAVSEQPYANPLGLTYDSGGYEQAMDKALALADWHGFAKRRRDAKKRGKRLGIGISNYIEITSGNPRERAEVIVQPEGRVDVIIGTLASGQGHETSFAQLVTEWLGVPFDCIRLVTGDTDIVPIGGGSHSGRSMRMAGIVIGKASEAVIARGKAIAARLLEAAEIDIDFSGGKFFIAGTDRSVSLFEVAAAAANNAELPNDLRGPLAAASDEIHPVAGFPYGCAVAEVEVDPETGAFKLTRYTAVDDVGRAINPLILHAQAHGAATQGIGQVLGEQMVYDCDSGQLLSGSLMDYRMPRAGDLPFFTTAISEVPSPTNPLGIRAGGEGATTPALAVMTNAIVDALAEFGVEHIELPATPMRIWQAIKDAKPA